MGTAFGMGSVYLDVVESYQTTRPLAAIVLSLASGMGFGAGIITGPVIGHVGGATTMVAGSLLCCVGCIGSSLAPNIYVVIVCFGAITGLGVSCCYLSAAVIAGTSFQENSKVVLPMVSMSGGVGMTVFPYMLRWLVDEFTLKGMFLILAGVSLNSVLFGVVLKVFEASRDPAPGEDDLEVDVEAVPVREMRKGKESWSETSMHAKGEHTLVKSESKKSICNEEKNDTMKLESTENIGNERTGTVMKSDRGDSISDTQNATVKKSICGDINGKARNLISNESIPDTANMMEIEPYELDNVFIQATCKKPKKEKNIEPDENEETSDVGNVVDEGDISEEHFHDDKNETRRQAENGSASHTRQNGMVTERRSEQERKEVPYNEHGQNKDMMLETLSRRGHSNVSFENDVDDMETALHMDEWNRRQEPRGMIKESSAVSLSKKVQISSPADDTQRNNTETDDVTQRRRSTAAGRRRSSVYEALQVGLFHNTRWVLVTIATYSRFLSFNLPGIFLTDIGRERGLSVEQGTHLLVILYCSNVAGRGLIGLILYIRHFSSLGLLGATTLIAGLAAYGFTLLDYYETTARFTLFIDNSVAY
ncbi:uncharacterized protein [Littorina saxatilis]|uniref:uncharacterized protein n=1 Tax=Littorina saxatilis TaxID=31220 RepID=UPI0038B521F0